MAVNARIKDLAPGAVFDIGPVNAVILEHFPNGKTLLATAKSIGKRRFTTQPFVYNRAKQEPAANNFAFSTLRFDLNDDFLSDLDAAGVIPVNRIADTTWDLYGHDYRNRYGSVTCKIGLLSEAQVRKYYDAGLLEIKDWEWTLTPYTDINFHVLIVNKNGDLTDVDAWYGDYGVRPVFLLDSDVRISLEPDEVDLSDSALLRDFTTKRLADEVVRRIAAGEDFAEDE